MRTQLLQCTCQELGVPVAVHKTEGPSFQLTFLGIQRDTIKMQLSLPPDKLARITATVRKWRSRKAATKKQLQSLIGLLSHAATVVIPGRAFLRCMIDTMIIPKCQHHHVRLNQDFQSDIQWWARDGTGSQSFQHSRSLILSGRTHPGPGDAMHSVTP